MVLEGQGKGWEWLGWWLLEKASKDWDLEGSGLGSKLPLRSALVPLRVLEGDRRGSEKAARKPKIRKNLEKLDA